jgi:myosin heavy subunit
MATPRAYHMAASSPQAASAPRQPRPGSQPPHSSSSVTAKEVDYYLNPTELFRWINYRRWDGARSRAQSHPDEAATWIVSRHSSDGRILWRHLPLHLVCMQREASVAVEDLGDSNAVLAAHQMELLVDILLDSYPEGASSPDDQGMLPLHLLLSKAENEPNERVINLILTSFPNAVDVQDKFGRTPYDILREQCQEKGVTSDRCRAAFRALKRARYVSDRISSTIQNESANIVAVVQQEATNERGASQKIIVRLEEELNSQMKEMAQRDAREKNWQEEVRKLKNELASMEGALEAANINLDAAREERDMYMSENESMKSKVKHHDEIVQRTRSEAQENRQGDIETIAKLKSEVSTAKAMAEALESQLRSRFTNEDYLSSTVSDLEEQLEELKVRNEHASKKHQHELDSLTADNQKLKKANDELTKKNAQLTTKLSELSKQMGDIMSSHGALCSEYDRCVEASEHTESSMLESIRSERAQLVESFAQQRQAFEKAFAEQERAIEQSIQRQDNLLAKAHQSRAVGRSTMDDIRKEFQDIRAAAAERERLLHAQAIAANRKSNKTNSTIHRSPSSSSRFSTGSTTGESRNPLSSRTHQHISPRLGTTMNQVSSSQSSSDDGHLVRLLDKRAAAHAQSSGIRDQKMIPNPTSSDSSTQHESYYLSPQRHHANMKPPYGTHHQNKGSEYSLDQYSHDASESTSTCSSYAMRGPRRSMEPPPNHDDGGHLWKGNKYVSNSYCDESSVE